MNKRLTFTGLAAAGLVAMATMAPAQNLRIASAAPSAHPATYMYEKFAQYLEEESEGGIDSTMLGFEVVQLPQMKDALQSGLVDVGNFLPLYFPADMPQTGVAGDLALIGRSPHAMGLAMTEFLVTCESCQKELNEFGIVSLGAGSSDVYALITNEPVETAEDLQGLRLRSGGAPYSRWAEHFGATPVNIAVGDQFEAMSQGTIDGTMASIVDLLSFRLIDIAESVTMVPIGTYHVTSNFTIPVPTWEGLTPEQREQVGRAAARANLDLTDRWAFQLPAAAREALEGSDIQVIEPDPAFLEASEAFAQQDADAQVEKSGAEAAQFRDLVEKWTAIVEEVGENPEALAERAQTEIWDKVDWSTYGL